MLLAFKSFLTWILKLNISLLVSHDLFFVSLGHILLSVGITLAISNNHYIALLRMNSLFMLIRFILKFFFFIYIGVMHLQDIRLVHLYVAATMQVGQVFLYVYLLLLLNLLLKCSCTIDYPILIQIRVLYFNHVILLKSFWLSFFLLWVINGFGLWSDWW